jgi:protein-tyrosine phosphatase
VSRSTALDRHFSFEGCFNFRDLGGYTTADGRTVKWRRLFRSDSPVRLTASDLATVGELGVTTVLDLRSSKELEERGRFPEEPLRVAYHHLPMMDVLPEPVELEKWMDARFAADRYRDMLDTGAPAITSALRVLSSGDAYPAMFHCTAGKDRAGIMSAMTLGLLGVPDETIVADYLLSAEPMKRMLDWLRTEYPDRHAQLEQTASAALAVLPETMHSFLRTLREDHGSFEGYATSIGVPEAGERLREALLEPAPAT